MGLGSRASPKRRLPLPGTALPGPVLFMDLLSTNETHSVLNLLTLCLRGPCARKAQKFPARSIKKYFFLPTWTRPPTCFMSVSSPSIKGFGEQQLHASQIPPFSLLLSQLRSSSHLASIPYRHHFSCLSLCFVSAVCRWAPLGTFARRLQADLEGGLRSLCCCSLC